MNKLKLRVTIRQILKHYEDCEVVDYEELEELINDFDSWISVQTFLGNLSMSDIIPEIVNVEPIISEEKLCVDVDTEESEQADAAETDVVCFSDVVDATLQAKD